jgi:hypothetical protein
MFEISKKNKQNCKMGLMYNNLQQIIEILLKEALSPIYKMYLPRPKLRY